MMLPIVEAVQVPADAMYPLGQELTQTPFSRNRLPAQERQFDAVPLQLAQLALHCWQVWVSASKMEPAGQEL